LKTTVSESASTYENNKNRVDEGLWREWMDDVDGFDIYLCIFETTAYFVKSRTNMKLERMKELDGL